MNEYIDTEADLVINRLSRAKYNQLSSEHKLVPTELYFIDDEDFDVFNKRVINVDYPLDEKDGVNLGYLSSNFINQADILDYVDNTKLFDESQTSCLMIDGGLYAPRLLTNDWTVTVIKGDIDPAEVSVFYQGTPGEHSTGSGWAFKFPHDGKIVTIATGNEGYDSAVSIAGSDASNTITLHAIRPIHWDKKDGFVKASDMYSYLSSVNRSSDISEVADAIANLNAFLSSFLR